MAEHRRFSLWHDCNRRSSFSSEMVQSSLNLVSVSYTHLFDTACTGLLYFVLLVCNKLELSISTVASLCLQTSCLRSLNNLSTTNHFSSFARSPQESSISIHVLSARLLRSQDIMAFTFCPWMHTTCNPHLIKPELDEQLVEIPCWLCWCKQNPRVSMGR